MRTYRNAFNCRRCPGNNGDRGCPAWIKDTWENEQTGDVKIVEDCIFQLMPDYLKWSAGRAAKTLETAQELRNENMQVVQAFGKALHQMQTLSNQLVLENTDDGK